MQPDAPRWTRAALLLLALGAALGTALDAIHTHTGTTAYTHPVAFGAAWWVPLTFALAGLAVGLPRAALERRRPSSPLPTGRAVGASLALFVLAYALSGTVPGNVPRALALAAVFAVSWFTTDRTVVGLALAIGTGIGGMAAEVTMVHLGLFQHLQPTYLGIPVWLPGLYATAQVAIGNLGRRWVGA